MKDQNRIHFLNMMQQITSSLEGRLRNTDLPLSKCLYPIFEAVVNSVYAIDDRIETDKSFTNVDGEIRIIIKREGNTHLFGDKPDITSIIIEDNGIGFDQNNYNSFCELDSMYRANRGCKGIGRLLWLKAFQRAKIQSVYSDGDKLSKRSFLFTKDGLRNLTDDSNDKKIGTTIELEGVISKYAQAVNKQSQETIAKAVFEHCLWFFLRKGGCPDIRVIDGDKPATNLSEIYDSYLYGENSNEESFVIEGETFNVLHVLVQRSERNNMIAYCAGNRIVKDEKIKDVLGLYDSAIQTSEGAFFYKCFVTSSFLDESVSPERFSFLIPEEKENDEQLEAMSQIYFADIRKCVVEKITNFLAPYLQENIHAGKEKLMQFVDNKAPYYKPILSSLQENEKIVNPNATEKSMDLLLHSKLTEKEHLLLSQGHDLLTVRRGESDEDYNKRIDNYINDVQQLKQSDLTRYVLHRKCILEILKDALRKNDNGKYSKEEKIHQLIMPMHVTSDDESFLHNNLWIIDERLVFHHYLASDKTFDSMKITDCDSLRRPDVLVTNMYDNPMFLSDKDNPPYASMRIVEFKRPMRDDMESDDETKNPIDQCIDYVEKIRAGKCLTKNGRPMSISEEIPAYCYVVCDLTPSMKNVCRKHDLRKTYDNLGYFGYKSELKIYFEVISFDQLLNSALERNASFFNVLGISHS